MSVDIGEEQYWEWIPKNWKAIRCAALVGPGLAFEAALAIRKFDGRPWSIWDSIVRGAFSASEFVGCLLTEDDIAAIFPENDQECQKVNFGGQLIARIDAGLGAAALQPYGGIQGALEIIDQGSTPGGNSWCKYKSPGGGVFTETAIRQSAYEQFNVRWYIRPVPGDTCAGLPLPPLPVPPDPPPFVIEGEGQGSTIDPDGEIVSCGKATYEVRQIDAALDARGILWTKYRIYGIRYENPLCRNPPSVSSNKRCYWESSEGVIWVNCDELGLPFQGYVDRPNCNPGLSEVRYSVSAGCTWNEEEQKYDTVYHADVNGTDNGILGLAWRLDAIAWLLEKVNLIPYGICGNDTKPELEGDWRTISFISDETSPEGKSRLRKRFRYRSTSSIDLNGLVDHWKDFTWKAGPVCVRHSGASWGDPQVWASTADEGKRVIRHAGREAGLDPDQVGKWGVSGSRNPRYGMPGTMRVNTKGGYYWITDRLESDNRPQVLAP